MRYFAALLSVLMHVLIVLFLVDFVMPENKQSDFFGIELVSVSEIKHELKPVPSHTRLVQVKDDPRAEASKVQQRPVRKPKFKSDNVVPDKVSSGARSGSEKVQPAKRRGLFLLMCALNLL